MAVVRVGADLQKAVDACPPGGCLLLEEGVHILAESLFLRKEVHLFGRGTAELRASGPFAVVQCLEGAGFGGMFGVNVRKLGGGSEDKHGAVHIAHGRFRLEGCQLIVDSLESEGACLVVEGASASPTLLDCRRAQPLAVDLLFLKFSSVAASNFSSPRIWVLHCRIAGSQTYGIHARSMCNGRLERCEICGSGAFCVQLTSHALIKAFDCG